MYKRLFILLIPTFTLGYTPPPPAPNYCSDKYCIELFPADTSDKRFITPTVKNYDFDNKSIMSADYNGIGNITIIGPFSVYKRTPHFEINRIGEVLIAHNCKYADFKNNSQEVCSQYVITTNQHGITKKPLLCLVATLWEKNKDQIPNLATIKIYSDQNINSYCLNNR